MPISKPGRYGLVLTPALLLAACGEDPPVSPDPIEAPGAEVVECAIGVGSEYAAECSVERLQVDGDAVLVVNHPGGGFRRFTLASDGSGLTSYDGADEAARVLDGDVLELTVGTDRYRFPARRINETPDAEIGADNSAPGTDENADAAEAPDTEENAGS